MTDSLESYSMPEVVRLLKGLIVDVRDLRNDVHNLGTMYITRSEFVAWQTAYDREVKEIKEKTAPVKVSPWTIASFAIAALVGLGSLLGLTITLINVVR